MSTLTTPDGQEYISSDMFDQERKDRFAAEAALKDRRWTMRILVAVVLVLGIWLLRMQTVTVWDAQSEARYQAQQAHGYRTLLWPADLTRAREALACGSMTWAERRQYVYFAQGDVSQARCEPEFVEAQGIFFAGTRTRAEPAGSLPLADGR